MELMNESTTTGGVTKNIHRKPFLKVGDLFVIVSGGDQAAVVRSTQL